MCIAAHSTMVIQWKGCGLGKPTTRTLRGYKHRCSESEKEINVCGWCMVCVGGGREGKEKKKEGRRGKAGKGMDDLRGG